MRSLPSARNQRRIQYLASARHHEL
jgi:hypothetical protein